MTFIHRCMPLFLAAFLLLAASLPPGVAQAKASSGIETALSAGKGQSSAEPDFLSPDEAVPFQCTR